MQGSWANEITEMLQAARFSVIICKNHLAFVFHLTVSEMFIVIITHIIWVL